MHSWHYEITRALLLLLAALVIGYFSGLSYPILFLSLVALLIFQFYQISRLESWLRSGGIGKYPKCKGIWEGIYYQIYRIKKSDKQRKKRLGEMVKRFRTATAALPDAAVVLGDHDQIEWLNKAARQTLGLKKADKGQRLPNLIRHPEFIQYLKSYNDKIPITMPSPVDESIILEFRVVQYGAGFRLLIAHDVTKLKKMERMRKDFVANVSHELRTPLTVLKGYLETLQDYDDGSSPLMSRSFEQMKSQTERMEHLVDDLLLLTRLETQKKKSQCVDVPFLLTGICQEADKLNIAAGRIQLKLETDSKLYGDEQELRSAFTNLVVNALKYSPDDAPVEVRWYRTDNAARLDVIDFGEGIAASDIPRVTERFYRVDVNRSRKMSGTGLGLAIVKHVLVRHQAQLKIDSTLGKGSCFSCIFPLKRCC